jgi:hypothetical protein
MQLFATFESHNYLEVAIAALEKLGIKKESIFVVPLDNRNESRKLFDTLHRADGITLIDIGMALGTAFSVIGASIGFKLSWGPIFWGLMGAACGFVLGVVIRLWIEVVYKKRRRVLKGKHSEIIVIVDCDEEKAERVEEILWDHFALGVAKMKNI